MPARRPQADPQAVAEWLAAAPEPARSRVLTLADVVRAEAPDAIERVAYGLLTWHQGENLLHFGAFAGHVGVYPGPEAVASFAAELEGFETSKGTIRVPHDAPLPVDLVRRITRWRLARARR